MRHYLSRYVYLTDTGKVIKKLRTQNKKRIQQRLKGLQKGYAEGRLDWEAVKRSLASTNGHLIHGHTWRLRDRFFGKAVFVRND